MINLSDIIYLIYSEVYGLKHILLLPILEVTFADNLYGKSIVFAIIITENL